MLTLKVRVWLAVLPAKSVSVTVRAGLPLRPCISTAVKLVLQRPLLDTVAVRAAKLPSSIVMVAPASPKPLRVWSSCVSARLIRLSPAKALTLRSRAAVSSVRLRTVLVLTLPARSVCVALRRMLPSPSWAHSADVRPCVQAPVVALANRILLTVPNAPFSNKLTVASGSAAPFKTTWACSSPLMRSSPATGSTTGAKARESSVKPVSTMSLTLPAKSICRTLSCKVPSPT